MLNGLLELFKGIAQAILKALDSQLDADALRFSSNSALSVLIELMKYLSILGVCLTIMYFLIDFSQKIALEGRDINFKSILGPFLKLFIAVLLISHGADIMQGAIQISNDIIAKADTAGSASPLASSIAGKGAADLSEARAKAGEIKKAKAREIAEGIVDSIEGAASSADNPSLGKATLIMVHIIKLMAEGKFFVLLLAVLAGVISWLLNTILSLVWWWKALQYKLEFVFRVGYAPVAFADIYNGLNSSSIRYIKGFIALGLYGASLLLLPKISQALAYDVLLKAGDLNALTDIWSLFVGLIQASVIAPFAAITASSAVKTIAREAMGA